MYCSKCGAAVPEGAVFCSVCGQSTGSPGGVQTQVGVLPPPPPPPQMVASGVRVLYAGFWLRLVAAIIDNLILGVPSVFLFFLLFAGMMPMLMHAGEGGNPTAVVFMFLPRIMALVVISVVGRWLYWSLMEASECQATLGKKALGLYVTDMEGRRTTFGRTSGRFWGGRGISAIPYLGGLYYLIDCIMCGFTERKQALHDMIANCLVLRKA
jgi:uncharacterized RDD family membrane protein YckC